MRRALVVGNGKSGKSACKMLEKLGYMVYVTEDKQKNLNRVYRDRFMQSLSLIVLSPGIPANHKVVELAKYYGIDFLCEFELGTLFLQTKTIMITGTNGKTTTTMLTHKLMEKSKFERVFMGGNVGIPVSSFALDATARDIAVLEASSFQLEYKKRSAPNIAVFLNIAPDHLSRHGTMEKYLNAKLKIFEGQTESDFAVINFDDKVLVEKTKQIKAQKYYFSIQNKVKGCYVENGSIYFNDEKNITKIAETKNIKILGNHNLQNALASVLAAVLAGQNIEKIEENLYLFKGVSHRLEWIMDFGGVSFFNDSKATNIASTIVAMNAMTSDTTIILGGSDKGLDFDELFMNVPEKIVNFVCIGETKNKLIESAKRCNAKNVYEAESLKKAVELGVSLSKVGDNVLLSPACASFDMFSSYEERGKIFTNIVREMAKHEDKLKSKITQKK